MSPEEFKVGDTVIYIPSHASGDPEHPDCERGLVTSINAGRVFVRYYRYGLLQETAQGTIADYLVKT